MRDTVNHVECYGGPLDGKNMPVPSFVGDHACMIHFEPDGAPHFYVNVPRDGVDTMMYGGNDPRDVVRVLRDYNPDAAQQLEEGLDIVDAKIRDLYENGIDFDDEESDGP